ncbi:phage major capsid protein [Limosilactobacillus panis]|uniref:phage major capsid protein n=1 Tax=Limosilactobacillus panis TaxID=47493 RepID=UPI001C95DFC7|nr:phage major capsid protein [Limosilactobacillus panis]QZN93812.1 phage major capsid protein [Limosilactobacillus panis]UUF81131.1 phage major capsid protein [Xanthomonas oryzae pv. oryzae]
MDINKINDAWIAAGQKVADLDNKLAIQTISDDFEPNDEFKALKEQRDNAKIQRDTLKEQLDEARANEVYRMKDEDKKPLNDKQLDLKDKFVRDFKDMVTTGKTDAGNAGLTIPDDIQTTIHTLVRQYASLQNLVNVERVTTPTGSRVYEKFSEIKPLANLDDETAKIGDNDDPELTTIKYLIHRYAGITTVTNTLLKDTAENILSWLSTWIARKVVVTRNQEILKVLDTASKKPTIANFDDIKDLQLNTLDPAIIATSSFVTNQSGFAVLAKVKDAQGRYMIQRDVTNPEQYRIGGKPVMVVADRWLPDVSGAHPLYYGDFKQAVTLFDRENMSLLSTNIGGGAFESDETKIRVIDRFDVEQVDGDAYAVASFKAVENQQATTPETSGATTTK